MFTADSDKRAEKKPKIHTTPIIFGGKRHTLTPSQSSKSPTSLCNSDNIPDGTNDSTDDRLQMHHFMHYKDNQTDKEHLIVIFTLYPGTDITQEIAKDGRQILYHIRSPNRLLAQEFVNKEKTQASHYNVFDDMTYFKSYTPQAYTYRVHLPHPVLTHSDSIQSWWVESNGARSLVPVLHRTRIFATSLQIQNVGRQCIRRFGMVIVPGWITTVASAGISGNCLLCLSFSLSNPWHSHKSSYTIMLRPSPLGRIGLLFSSSQTKSRHHMMRSNIRHESLKRVEDRQIPMMAKSLFPWSRRHTGTSIFRSARTAGEIPDYNAQLPVFHGHLHTTQGDIFHILSPTLSTNAVQSFQKCSQETPGWSFDASSILPTRETCQNVFRFRPNIDSKNALNIVVLKKGTNFYQTTLLSFRHRNDE